MHAAAAAVAQARLASQRIGCGISDRPRDVETQCQQGAPAPPLVEPHAPELTKESLRGFTKVGSPQAPPLQYPLALVGPSATEAAEVLPEKSAEPVTPQLPPRMEVCKLDGTRPAVVGLSWGGDDDSHLQVSRVEVQIWDIDRGDALQLLGQPGADHLFGSIQLQGCMAVFLSDVDVSFPDSRGPPAAVAVGPLLKKEILPAHVGSACAPAPVTVDNLPRCVPMAIRLRLYSNALAPGDRMKKNKCQPRSRYGPWCHAILLAVLPDTSDTAGGSSPNIDALRSALSNPAHADDPSLIRIKALTK